MTERCGDHSMLACLECARHQRGVRHCCPRHHRGQDSSPGGSSGPQSSVAKRARSASAVGHPEVVDKRRRQQEGQRELIDLTINEPAVPAALTRVRRRASAGCEGVRDGARKRARTVQPMRNVSLPVEAQRRLEPERPPALHLGAPPWGEPAPPAPPLEPGKVGGDSPSPMMVYQSLSQGTRPKKKKKKIPRRARNTAQS